MVNNNSSPSPDDSGGSKIAGIGCTKVFFINRQKQVT